MLTHKGTVEIRTERLLLRAFRVDDAEDIFNIWTKDPRVAKYTAWEAHKSVEDTKAFVNYIVQQNSEHDYNWIIEIKNKVIGTISVCYSDEVTEIAGIAYTLGYDYWGKGYMTEVAKAVKEFLFEEVNYRKIIAGCDSENISSSKVMENIGMKREAVLRKQIKRKDGTWGDDYQYGLLRGE